MSNKYNTINNNLFVKFDIPATPVLKKWDQYDDEKLTNRLDEILKANLKIIEDKKTINKN